MASKLFISHSAKSEEHLTLRDQLVAELQAAGIETWVDATRIKTGDEWLTRITEGLNECYAGIVLFSTDALDSDFVKYEVSNLAQRKRMHSGFGLFALNLGDVSLASIRDGFYGSIRFPDFQIVGFRDGHTDVVNALSKLQPPDLTPTRQLEGSLLSFFPDGLRDTLRVIAKSRGWQVWDRSGSRAELLYFIRMLVSQPMEEQIEILAEVMGGLSVGADVRDLFNKLAISWVDEKAALQLDAVQLRADEKRGALLNGRELMFTCEAFLRRAHPTRGRAILVHTLIPTGRYAERRLAKQVLENLSKQLSVSLANY